ncbi:MAG: VPDSG-CTERM sorting domain-containing protein [Verrucomicrobia bacterium]|nr:VPDSG-CTERM sorting domain-containing protein [Verrucomicrobiota bacterium]
MSVPVPPWIDQTITAIFGSGNPDTGWTTGTGTGGIELGLRARNRDDGTTPNVNGEYAFLPGLSAAVILPWPFWNFEFSIDVGAQMFTMYDFYLGIDMDSGVGVDYVNSLINPLSWRTTATESSANGQGDETSFANAQIEGYTIAQNSLNIAFLGLDPNAPGIYDYRLFAVSKLSPDDVNNSPLPDDGGNPFINSLPSDTQSAPIADVNIRVVVGTTSVPDAGSTWAFLSLGLVGLAGLRRRFVA